MTIALARASIKSIIELNGAVLGFFFIYCFPVFIHLRCAFMKHDKLLDKPKEEPIQNYNEMIEEKEYKKDDPQEGAG